MIQVVVADQGWVFVGSVGNGNPMEEVNPYLLKSEAKTQQMGPTY